MPARGNSCIREETCASPGGQGVLRMPGFPRPSAEKISASLAANRRAARFTRRFPAFHCTSSVHLFSMPLGESKQHRMTPQEAICFLKMFRIQPRAHEREGYKLSDSGGMERGRLCNLSPPSGEACPSLPRVLAALLMELTS